MSRRSRTTVFGVLLMTVVACVATVLLAVGQAAPDEGAIRDLVAERIGVRPVLIERFSGVLDQVAGEIRNDLVDQRRADLQRNVAIALIVDVCLVAGATWFVTRQEPTRSG